MKEGTKQPKRKTIVKKKNKFSTQITIKKTTHKRKEVKNKQKRSKNKETRIFN